MTRQLLSGATLALMLVVSNASAQSAPSAASLATQAKKLESDLKKQLELAIAMKHEAEAAAKAAAQKKAEAAAAMATATSASSITGKSAAPSKPATGVVSAADAAKLSAMAATGGLSLDVKGMDLEAVMLRIQTERAQFLETQLKEQVAAVKVRNDSIARLNAVLRTLAPLAARFPANARADAATKDYVSASDIAAWQRAARDAGVAPSDISTKAAVDAQQRVLKDRIDAMVDLEQRDMVSLQKLSEKRNETFEMLTNVMKKMQEQQKGIISNIRP
jgi:hypothetical protein